MRGTQHKDKGAKRINVRVADHQDVPVDARKECQVLEPAHHHEVRGGHGGYGGHAPTLAGEANGPVFQGGWLCARACMHACGRGGVGAARASTVTVGQRPQVLESGRPGQGAQPRDKGREVRRPVPPSARTGRCPRRLAPAPPPQTCPFRHKHKHHPHPAPPPTSVKVVRSTWGVPCVRLQVRGGNGQHSGDPPAALLAEAHRCAVDEQRRCPHVLAEAAA